MITDIYQQLRRDEGEELFAYQDSKGLWTIGVGACIDRKIPGAGITQEESAYLLQNRVTKIENIIHSRLPWFQALDDARQGVLKNMGFNLGFNGLEKFPEFLRATAQGDWEAAAFQLKNSEWAKQVGDRAVRLQEQIRTGTWQ